MSISAHSPFKRPHELVASPAVMPEIKRMLLASWASDRYTVESAPSLRQPPEFPEPVPVDEVLAALRELDHQNDREGPQ